jgi:hypothetical protein
MLEGSDPSFRAHGGPHISPSTGAEQADPIQGGCTEGHVRCPARATGGVSWGRVCG